MIKRLRALHRHLMAARRAPSQAEELADAKRKAQELKDQVLFLQRYRDVIQRRQGKA